MSLPFGPVGDGTYRRGLPCGEGANGRQGLERLAEEPRAIRHLRLTHVSWSAAIVGSRARPVAIFAQCGTRPFHFSALTGEIRVESVAEFLSALPTSVTYTSLSPRRPLMIAWMARAAKINPMMRLTTLAPVGPSTPLYKIGAYQAGVGNCQYE